MTTYPYSSFYKPSIRILHQTIDIFAITPRGLGEFDIACVYGIAMFRMRSRHLVELRLSGCLRNLEDVCGIVEVGLERCRRKERLMHRGDD
jgi:hypothetical protein